MNKLCRHTLSDHWFSRRYPVLCHNHGSRTLLMSAIMVVVKSETWTFKVQFQTLIENSLKDTFLTPITTHCKRTKTYFPDSNWKRTKRYILDSNPKSTKRCIPDSDWNFQNSSNGNLMFNFKYTTPNTKYGKQVSKWYLYISTQEWTNYGQVHVKKRDENMLWKHLARKPHIHIVCKSCRVPCYWDHGQTSKQEELQSKKKKIATYEIYKVSKALPTYYVRLSGMCYVQILIPQLSYNASNIDGQCNSWNGFS